MRTMFNGFSLTAEDLELYTTSKDLRRGCTRAAVTISKAMSKVPALVGELVAEGRPVPEAIYFALRKLVRPVLNRNAKYGAADTEPETVITDMMEDHFELPEYSLNRFEWV